MNSTEHPVPDPLFNTAELGVLAHLYRGEMYRSKIWRTRLDTTTNWAVATTGIALSVTFSSPENSPLPLILIAMLIMLFLAVEGRRYRYFDIWRTRVRLFEVGFYGPILRREGVRVDNGWSDALARDYSHLHFHISYWEAIGRRLRRNYSWLFIIQAISYMAKIIIHPTRLETLEQLWERAAIGPLPGQVVLLMGVLVHACLMTIAVGTLRRQHAAGRVGRPKDYEDPLLKFERQDIEENDQVG